ncbi:MAG: hypothetical protein AB7D20_10875 [Sulfuricurvum sp.]|uniref:hypothetical protein n=1 Tax=Sulfuricurvum sp. TaxID=2025608 RepID=UPI003D141118
MLSVQINNPQVENFFHHSSESIVQFLENAVAHLEKNPSFIVSSMDDARARVERARKSDDTLSEEEYKSDMEAFWKSV